MALLAAGTASVGWAGETMTADQYLAQVEQVNPDLRGIDLALQAMGLKVLELDMVYSPFLSASYGYMDDRSGSSFGASLPMDEVKGDQWSLFLDKKFPSGTSLSLGYTHSDSSISLLQPSNFGFGLMSDFNAFENKPVVQLKQSLLRDFWYGLTQVGIDKSKASVRSGQYLQLYKRQQLLMKARLTYWNLVLDREVVQFRQSSLERAQQVLQWNQKRVGLDLADAADLLQAQAAYKSRQLSLQMAKEDLLNAKRDFNELLGNTTAAVAVDLERLEDKVNQYATLDTLTRSGERADVLAARAAYQSSALADRETFFRSLPELTLSASYSLYGLDLTSQAAWDQVANGDKPAYTVALSGIIPLDIWTLDKVRQGYHKDFEAVKANLEKAELMARNDWGKLSQTWQDVKTRLALAREIKTIQEKRLAHEQRRLERGRSTTFQVITAENDLDEANLNVYRLVYEELVTDAQAGLFDTQPIQ